MASWLAWVAGRRREESQMSTGGRRLLLDLSGKLYKHCYNCFLFGPASSCFSQHLKVFKF